MKLSEFIIQLVELSAEVGLDAKVVIGYDVTGATFFEPAVAGTTSACGIGNNLYRQREVGDKDFEQLVRIV